MFLDELAGKEINEWSGARFDCPCGCRHSLDTAFFLGVDAEKTAAEAAGTLAPSGCAILLLRQEPYDVGDLSRVLRRGGYKVCERILPDDADFSELEALQTEDDVRAVIAVGGGYAADCAKYVSAYSGLPCGVVVRAHSSPSFLVPSAALSCNGLPRLYKTESPKLLICDPTLLPSESSYNAAAFGAVVSRLIALFDWKFASLVRGEKICTPIYETALGEIDALLNRLRSASRRDIGVKTALFESGLRLSALAAMNGSSRLFSGGDTACSLALSMLQKYESRETRFQGENEFLFALLLAEIYPKMFTARSESGFLPPPDNNMRLEKMKEYFGADERTAALGMSPYLPDKLLKLYDYRLGEYADELKSELDMMKTRLKSAYRIFRRLYSDDGYSLQSYLDVSETKLCLALAPEMRSKYTALTHLKNMGLTDVYLID